MNSVDAKLPGRWVGALGWATLVAVVAAQVFGLVISAPDRDMGHLQKIMYVHVPTAWAAFLAFFMVFVWSVAYLVRRREAHDLLAASAAEVGAVFTALTLALGSIWGRPTWGIWWTWDPRLTTTAILLLIYVGYLALRAFTEEAERRARWSAAVGILGFLNVPIVYMSVRWWRTLHQPQSGVGTMDTAYIIALLANTVAFVMLFVYLLMRRYEASVRAKQAEARLEADALQDVVLEGGVRG